MVEGTCLENRRPFTWSVSSNLTASAYFMKILGIDYGEKKVGLALSDENAKLAFPKDIFLNDASVFKKIGKIIEEENISKIVIGDPGDNKVREKVKDFTEKLKEKFSLPVVFEKEFMTSLHVSLFTKTKEVARKTKKERGIKRDDSAAALILQRFLDKLARS